MPSHFLHTHKTPQSPAFPSRASAMFAFIESFKPFDVNKVKPYLKMAVQRIQIATNKKTAAVKYVVGRRGKGWPKQKQRPIFMCSCPSPSFLHTTTRPVGWPNARSPICLHNRKMRKPRSRWRPLFGTCLCLCCPPEMSLCARTPAVPPSFIQFHQPSIPFFFCRMTNLTKPHLNQQ